MSGRIINEYNPVSPSHPGTTLAEALEERGMSQAELAERTGRPRKTINEIVRGQTAIMPETAIQLERVLGISASFWNNRQRQFDECTARRQSEERLSSKTGWLSRFPIARMVRFGWIAKRPSKVLQLEALLSFFGIGSPEEWETLWKTPRMQTAFRESSAFQTDPSALSAWLRKGEIDAADIRCEPYDRKRFRTVLESIRILAKESPQGFERNLAEQCARAGVAVVFVPLLSGVHAWGATRWMTQDKAMIQLSLRGKYEDIFWFSFFHEAGHILLHGKKELFVESDGNDRVREEEEADVFARDLLIEKPKWERFVAGHPPQFSREEVTEFARGVGVSPGAIVGRLHHEDLLPPSHLNDLRRKIVFAVEEGR